MKPDAGLLRATERPEAKTEPWNEGFPGVSTGPCLADTLTSYLGALQLQDNAFVDLSHPECGTLLG